MSANILNLSDAVALALHAMLLLALSDLEQIPVNKIAMELGVSANHLSKVMQRLAKAGLIASTKGVGGGFKLLKKPKDITFMDIYEAIEGEFRPISCLLGNETCYSECLMRDLIKSTNRQLEDYLKTTKLSDFENKSTPISP